MKKRALVCMRVGNKVNLGKNEPGIFQSLHPWHNKLDETTKTWYHNTFTKEEVTNGRSTAAEVNLKNAMKELFGEKRPSSCRTYQGVVPIGFGRTEWMVEQKSPVLLYR